VDMKVDGDHDRFVRAVTYIFMFRAAAHVPLKFDRHRSRSRTGRKSAAAADVEDAEHVEMTPDKDLQGDEEEDDDDGDDNDDT